MKAGRGSAGGRREGRRQRGSRGKGEARGDTPGSVQALHSGLGEVLLHPEPRVVEASAPSFKGWAAVPLINHNTLPATINGHPCVLYVDSGTTSPMIAHTLAAKLGLLDKVSFMKNYELQLWTTKVRHNLKVVQNVEVKLAGGVALNCIFLVLPEDMALILPDILLDNSTLRQAGAVQEFTASSCILYFPNRKLTRLPRRGGDCQYVVDSTFRRSILRRKRMNIHVDTGATCFYVSPRCLYTQLGMPRVPECVSLVLGEGVTATSGLVRVAGTDTFDFVVGKEMLSRYRCILDFASSCMYVRVNDRVFRLNLRKSRTV